jgi:hypothetical protein
LLASRQAITSTLCNSALKTFSWVSMPITKMYLGRLIQVGLPKIASHVNECYSITQFLRNLKIVSHANVTFSRIHCLFLVNSEKIRTHFNHWNNLYVSHVRISSTALTIYKTNSTYVNFKCEHLYGSFLQWNLLVSNETHTCHSSFFSQNLLRMVLTRKGVFFKANERKFIAKHWTSLTMGLSG